MQSVQLGFRVCFVLLVIIVSIQARSCNPKYLKESIVLLGTKENFLFFPWSVYQPVEGTVKFMEIRNQFVKELCKYYLSNTLMEVIFINTYLDYIEPGYFESALLEQVYIEGNNLSKIEEGVFSNTLIRSLVLPDNKIEIIEDNAFANMTRLEAISLDYNNLKKFDPNWFNGAQFLYEITVDHNNITELPEGTTKNMIEHFDKDPSSRIFGCIDFDNNNIQYIHPLAFHNLKTFGVISLSNNELLILPHTLFKRMDFLFNLYMNTNRFICFSNKTIESFHGVKRMFVAGNKMNEDCKTVLKEYFGSKNDLVFLGI